MDNGNETPSRDCRFLTNSHFDVLYETFIEAFSDYVFPFALTEDQFRNHIRLNGVDLSRTAGAFVDDRLVGFSLNGFGRWAGRSTVYDAGTAVIPQMRRRGISHAMFEMMMPHFRQQDVKQWLLEVVTTNTAAIRLYEKLGFERIRELALLQCDIAVTSQDPPRNVEFREVRTPDWELLSGFWDGVPSWQNSVDAINRSSKLKRIIGGFDGESCVGYVVSSTKFGRISQIAVDRLYRNRGIGTELIRRVQVETVTGYSTQVVNVDKALSSALSFFQRRGFYERLSQHEMLARL